MTPTKAECIELELDSVNVGNDIVVSYNNNFDETNPLGDGEGLICVYPCSGIECENKTLPCGDPIPPNCVTTDSAGEAVFKTDGSPSQVPRPVLTFLQADGSENTCFTFILFRNEDAIPEIMCCTDVNIRFAASTCPNPNT